MDINHNYYWTTEYPHYNNTTTMGAFLDYHLPSEYDVLLSDGTYAEIINSDTGEVWEVHASGDGDSYHHKIEFVKLGE